MRRLMHSRGHCWNLGPATADFQGTYKLSGLDPSDVIVLEVWVVLKKTITAGTQGNVQSAIISGSTYTRDLPLHGGDDKSTG